MRVEPITLETDVVRLEPLDMRHLDVLCAFGLDPAIWQWMAGACATREELREYLQMALDDLARGGSLPFVTVLREGDRVVGTTRYGNISVPNRRVEIGWTWIDPAFQRTAVNTHAKFLMLRHAFETWQCNRVELKTDALNARSRAAMERIGATFEGVFRRHMVTDSGRVRDTAWYAFIREEWPATRARLEALMQPRA